MYLGVKGLREQSSTSTVILQGTSVNYLKISIWRYFLCGMMLEEMLRGEVQKEVRRAAVREAANADRGRAFEARKGHFLPGPPTNHNGQ